MIGSAVLHERNCVFYRSFLHNILNGEFVVPASGRFVHFLLSIGSSNNGDRYNLCVTLNVALLQKLNNGFLSVNCEYLIDYCLLFSRKEKEFWLPVFERLINVDDCNDTTLLDSVIRDFKKKLAEVKRRKVLEEVLLYHSHVASGQR